MQQPQQGKGGGKQPTVQCRHFEKGFCQLGANCGFLHGSAPASGSAQGGQQKGGGKPGGAAVGSFAPSQEQLAANEARENKRLADLLDARSKTQAHNEPQLNSDNEDDEQMQQDQQDWSAGGAGASATAAVAAVASADAEMVEKTAHLDEHAKDSLEGSFRLKRLMSRDVDQPGAKRQKVHLIGSKETAKVEVIMKKWSTECVVVRHVLEQLPMSELEPLDKNNYTPFFFVPDKIDPKGKRPADTLMRHIVESREKLEVPGGKLDCVDAFCHRWRLASSASKTCHALKHKELRYVLSTYDGSQSLEDVISQASSAAAEDESAATAVLPSSPGVDTFARFNRMEIIDPLADCAVFGDANLTFSIKLAKHRKALGHVGRVIATTFEDHPTLLERYPEIDASIKTLEEHYAEVYHSVDCTKIALNPQFEGLENSMGAVYYNFPHSGAIKGYFDGHPVVNWRHENLMRLFFRALRTFVKPGGLVKVASNQGAVGVRYIYIVMGARENEFVHVETVPFLEWKLHKYGRSYGDKRDSHKRPDAVNNQSYNSQAATRDMVYCFRYQPSGKPMPPQPVRLPPTKKTLLACDDGPFRPQSEDQRKVMAGELFDRFVSEISGVHVG
jgi:hypothetical protein